MNTQKGFVSILIISISLLIIGGGIYYFFNTKTNNTTVYGPYSIVDENVFYKGELIEEVDIETFNVWRTIGYDKDKRTGNRDFIKAEETNDESLFYISYSTDKDYVYFGAEAVQGSDPSTLSRVKTPFDESYLTNVPVFLKDKNNIYYWHCATYEDEPGSFRVLEYLDSDSFEILSTTEKLSFRDKNGSYSVFIGRMMNCEIEKD